MTQNYLIFYSWYWLLVKKKVFMFFVFYTLKVYLEFLILVWASIQSHLRVYKVDERFHDGALAVGTRARCWLPLLSISWCHFTATLRVLCHHDMAMVALSSTRCVSIFFQFECQKILVHACG